MCGLINKAFDLSRLSGRDHRLSDRNLIRVDVRRYVIYRTNSFDRLVHRPPAAHVALDDLDSAKFFNPLDMLPVVDKRSDTSPSSSQLLDNIPPGLASSSSNEDHSRYS